MIYNQIRLEENLNGDFNIYFEFEESDNLIENNIEYREDEKIDIEKLFELDK